MFDWHWMKSGNRCNSLQHNAIDDRFGFQRQLLTPHFTGKLNIDFSNKLRRHCSIYFFALLRSVWFDLLTLNTRTHCTWPKPKENHWTTKFNYFVIFVFFSLCQICILLSTRYTWDNYRYIMKHLALKLQNRQRPKK